MGGYPRKRKALNVERLREALNLIFSVFELSRAEKAFLWKEFELIERITSSEADVLLDDMIHALEVARLLSDSRMIKYCRDLTDIRVKEMEIRSESMRIGPHPNQADEVQLLQLEDLELQKQMLVNKACLSRQEWCEDVRGHEIWLLEHRIRIRSDAAQRLKRNGQ